MNARFRPSSAGQAEGAADLSDATARPGPSASPFGQACCCVARAVVRVVMPPTAARPHETEMLLCGHHYRVSRAALATAHAAVSQLPESDDPAAWFPGPSPVTKVPSPPSPSSLFAGLAPSDTELGEESQAGG